MAAERQNTGQLPQSRWVANTSDIRKCCEQPLGSFGGYSDVEYVKSLKGNNLKSHHRNLLTIWLAFICPGALS